MSNVICRKCGATAMSKCPKMRSVFLNDQTVACQTWVLDTDDNTLTLYKTIPSGADPLDHLKDLCQSILSLTHKQLEQAACCHDWVMSPGQTCLFGCCKGEEKANEVQKD